MKNYAVCTILSFFRNARLNMTENVSVLTKYPNYEAVIGIEVHVQLSTRSKIFCRCNNGSSANPNTQIDVICCGHPGTLPVLNKQVVEYAIMAGIGTNCSIAPVCTFFRKHYFYPDLPKGYQITQGDQPICFDGAVVIKDKDGNDKTIRIMRIHMEEDAGKNTHVAGSDISFVDYNRAGSPLLEIVTHPDLSNSHEVRVYLKELHAIVTSLGIGTGNMEDGAFRADTNVSVRKKGATKLGTRCELKNINSFKFISDAVDYEIERQINVLESGEIVHQQTRLWDTKNKCTFVMREKSDAADYRYFTDPDLPRLEIHNSTIESIRKTIPELPSAKRARFVYQYGLSDYEVFVLTDEPGLASYFEEAYSLCSSPHIIKWIMREIMSFCKETKNTPLSLKFSPSHLVELVQFMDRGEITAKIARDVFDACVESGHSPKAYIQEHGLISVRMEESDIRALVQKVIEENPAQTAGYKSGKDKLLGFFVGKVMAATKGGVDPSLINQIALEELKK